MTGEWDATVRLSNSGDPSRKHETTLRATFASGVRGGLLSAGPLRLFVDGAPAGASTADGTLEFHDDQDGTRLFARLDRRLSAVADLAYKLGKEPACRVAFTTLPNPDGAEEVTAVSILTDGAPNERTQSVQRTYHHVITAAMAKPWAILESHLAVVAQILALRMNGERFTDEEIAERVGAAKPKRAKNTGAVAVIPIWGSIIPRGASFSDVSSGMSTSMEQLIGEVEAAAGDSNVSSILLDVDSPGGQVDMVPEAAAAIRRARQRKPVVAVANTLAASAAYWLASQARELVVSPSAEVGSIGVFAIHNDLSKQLEMLGINPKIIKAGKYKTELSPLAPLSAEAEAAAQKAIDEYYGMFTRDVAAGRGVGAEVARGAKFGEGRMVTARDAVAQGMADRIDTFDNTLARMLGGNLAGGASAEGWLTPSEAHANEELPEHADAAVEGDDEDITDIEAVEPEGAGGAASSHPEPGVGEAGPLADLRRASHEAARRERQEYLRLLGRMKR